MPFAPHPTLQVDDDEDEAATQEKKEEEEEGKIEEVDDEEKKEKKKKKVRGWPAPIGQAGAKTVGRGRGQALAWPKARLVLPQGKAAAAGADWLQWSYLMSPMSKCLVFS